MDREFSRVGGAALGELLGNSEDGDRLWFLNGQPISISSLSPSFIFTTVYYFSTLLTPHGGANTKATHGICFKKNDFRSYLKVSSH